MTSCPIDQQRFVYDCRVLKDENCIAQCNIEDKSIVHVVLRLRGGARTPTIQTIGRPKRQKVEAFPTLLQLCENTIKKGLSVGDIGKAFGKWDDMMTDSRFAILRNCLELGGDCYDDVVLPFDKGFLSHLSKTGDLGKWVEDVASHRRTLKDERMKKKKNGMFRKSKRF